MERKEGYYWVKQAGHWLMAYCKSNGWFRLSESSNMAQYPPSFFSEIDENRIPMPDENIDFDNPTKEMKLYKNHFLDELKSDGVTFTYWGGETNWDSYDAYKDEIDSEPEIHPLIKSHSGIMKHEDETDEEFKVRIKKLNGLDQCQK